MKRDVVQAAIAELTDSSGRIRPEDLVAAARDKKHPLHNDAGFVWDDKKAAALYNLDVARSLIRGVRVNFVVESRTIYAPAYVRDPGLPAKEQGYRMTSRIKTEQEMARQVVIDELERCDGALRRARDVADVLDLGDRFDTLLDQICALQTSFRSKQAA